MALLFWGLGFSFPITIPLKLYLFIDFRERKGKRVKHRFAVPSIMHSLVDSCMGSDWGLNLQP